MAPTKLRSQDNYPEVNLQKTMENHHVQWVNQLLKWQFSIAMLNHQRVITTPWFWIVVLDRQNLVKLWDQNCETSVRCPTSCDVLGNAPGPAPGVRESAVCFQPRPMVSEWFKPHGIWKPFYLRQQPTFLVRENVHILYIYIYIIYLYIYI